MSKDWYLKTPSYTSGYEVDEFAELAQSGFEEFLQNSPEAYTVTVNGNPQRVIVHSEDKANTYKTVLATVDTLSVGDMIVYKNRSYIIDGFVDDNKMYDKAIMYLCNGLMVFSGEETKTLVGHDPTGQPIYDTVKGADIKFPCHVDNKLLRSKIGDAEINLPSGMIVATVQYSDNERFAQHNKCNVLNKTYKIVAMDYSKSVQDETTGNITGSMSILLEQSIEG